MGMDARTIEKVLKWGAVPVALVVAFFVSYYSDALFGRGDAGLDASARSKFVDAVIAALLGQWFWWPRGVRTHAASAGAHATEDTTITQPLELNAINPEGSQ